MAPWTAPSSTTSSNSTTNTNLASWYSEYKATSDDYASYPHPFGQQQQQRPDATAAAAAPPPPPRDARRSFLRMQKVTAGVERTMHQIPMSEPDYIDIQQRHHSNMAQGAAITTPTTKIRVKNLRLQQQQIPTIQSMIHPNNVNYDSRSSNKHSSHSSSPVVRLEAYGGYDGGGSVATTEELGAAFGGGGAAAASTSSSYHHRHENPIIFSDPFDEGGSVSTGLSQQELLRKKFRESTKHRNHHKEKRYLHPSNNNNARGGSSQNNKKNSKNKDRIINLPSALLGTMVRSSPETSFNSTTMNGTNHHHRGMKLVEDYPKNNNNNSSFRGNSHTKNQKVQTFTETPSTARGPKRWIIPGTITRSSEEVELSTAESTQPEGTINRTGFNIVSSSTGPSASMFAEERLGFSTNPVPIGMTKPVVMNQQPEATREELLHLSGRSPQQQLFSSMWMDEIDNKSVGEESFPLLSRSAARGMNDPIMMMEIHNNNSMMSRTTMTDSEMNDPRIMEIHNNNNASIMSSHIPIQLEQLEPEHPQPRGVRFAAKIASSSPPSKDKESISVLLPIGEPPLDERKDGSPSSVFDVDRVGTSTHDGKPKSILRPNRFTVSSEPSRMYSITRSHWTSPTQAAAQAAAVAYRHATTPPRSQQNPVNSSISSTPPRDGSFIDEDGRDLSPIPSESVIHNKSDATTRSASIFIPIGLQETIETNQGGSNGVLLDYFPDPPLDLPIEEDSTVSSVRPGFLETVAAIVIQAAFRRSLAERYVSNLRELYIFELRRQLQARELTSNTDILRHMTQETDQNQYPLDQSAIIEAMAYDMYVLAAIQIQAIWRGFWTRDSIHVDHYCATVIQRAYHEYRRRKSINDKIIQRINAQIIERIVKIQAVWRRAIVRDRVAELLGAAVYIQAIGRGYVGRQLYLSQSKSSESMTMRGSSRMDRHSQNSSPALSWQQDLATVSYNTRKVIENGVTNMHQDHVRTSRGYQSTMSVEDGAATRIQARYRAFMNENRFVRDLVDVLIVQTVVRRWLAFRQVKRMKKAKRLTNLQSIDNEKKKKAQLLEQERLRRVSLDTNAATARNNVDQRNNVDPRSREKRDNVRGTVTKLIRPLAFSALNGPPSDVRASSQPGGVGAELKRPTELLSIWQERDRKNSFVIGTKR